MSDFAPRFGLALIVIAVAIAAIMISRRNYAKSATIERNIDAFRLEFQRSIDSAQAATIKGVAKTIRDSISSVIRPIDSTMRELDARLASLEQQQSEVAASHVAEAQTLGVRLAQLEERAHGSAIQELETRFAGLERHTEAATSQIAGTQKQALEENERIAARLIGVEKNVTELSAQLSSIKQTIDAATSRQQEDLATLSDQQQSLTALSEKVSSIKLKFDAATSRELENLAALSEQRQNLTALSAQLSSIKQIVDGATIREQDIKNSIDAVSARVLKSQTRLDELSPRLTLGDKARHEQGALIGLFVQRIKKINVDLSDMAGRIGALENGLRSKADQPEERQSSVSERTDSTSAGNADDSDKIGLAAGGAAAMATKSEGQNGGMFQPPPQGEESSRASLEREGAVENSHADQHAT